MTSKYYQQELESLRDTAVEFAAAYPTIAPQLGGPRPDPDVERILEGVAYLTGQIRSTLDEGFPEFAQGVLNQIFPHYLRSIPSATIIQFNPKKILKGELLVKKGTYVDSIPVDGVNCRFRTCYDVDVLPLSLERVTEDDSPGGRKVINLSFELQSLDLSNWSADKIRFFVGGDYPGAADLFYLLLRYLEKIEIKGESSEKGFVLSAEALRPLGLEKADAILEYPLNSFPAYRLLQEYFLMREKFLFFEVDGLQGWTERGTSKRFTMSFTLKNIPIPLPRLSVERFLLHATPAVNLFAADAEPVMLDNRKNELRIRPVRDSGGKVKIYSVDKVTGRSKGSTSKTDYVPLGVSFGNGGENPVYQVTFKTVQDNHVAPYMMVSYPKGYSLPDKETLSIQLTCTNGDLPASLRPGDISKPTSGTSELIEFRNIFPPTEHQNPPSDGAMLWRLLSHLSLNYLPIADVDNLRALLGLYIFSGGDKKNELANRRRIAGIDNIQVTPSDRLVRGSLMRGQEIEITIDREHFSSQGDLFVFGAVLDRLFASYSSLNVYSALNVKDKNSGEYNEWPATLGERSLI